MPQRVAGERVKREQCYVQSEDKRANADSELPAEGKRTNGVVPEKAKKKNRQIEKVAMNILQDERKRSFAAILAVGRFADGARGRIEKKRAVVSFAVVITGSSKTQRSEKNEQSGGKRPPMVPRIDERRIEGRKVRPPGVVSPFERAQRRVNAEATKQNDNRKDLSPPRIAAHGSAESGFGQERRRAGHFSPPVLV